MYIEEPFSLLPLEGMSKKLQRILSWMAVETREIDAHLERSDAAVAAAAAGAAAAEVVPTGGHCSERA